MMTRFVHTRHAASCASTPRAESGLEAAQEFSSRRGAALLLLSTLAATVMGVAYEVMDTPAEGHLLVLWMGAWALLFAALVLCADMALRLKGHLDLWSYRLAQARAEQRLWAMAQKDDRLMANLQRSLRRKEALVGKALAQAH